jgi:DNA-binding GntR family transcriptional regulator
VTLFLADGIPAVYSQNTIPSSLVKKPLELDALNQRIDMVMVEMCQREIAYFIADVNVHLVSGSTAEMMEVDEKTALLQVNCNFFDQESTPIVRGENYINQNVLALRLGQIIRL